MKISHGTRSIRRLKAEHERLKATCDLMLEALIGLVAQEEYEIEMQGYGESAALDHARAAIAAATGEST